MVRAILELILLVVVARSFWRVVGGVLDGLGVGPRTSVPKNGAPDRSVPMTRDPVCGTFVVAERAVSLHDGHQRVYFCSTTCRDAYRARPSTGSGRPDPSTSSGSPRARSRREPAEGRTA